MKLKIYGASDDLIEVDGDLREEFYADKIGKGLEGKTITLSRIVGGTVEGLDIHVRYERGGVWSVAVSQLDEDIDLPDWGYALKNESYSTVLELDRVPEDVIMTANGSEDQNY